MRHWRTFFGLLILLQCLPAILTARGSIARDEDLHFFPTYGYLSPDQRQWILMIHGHIYDPETDSMKRRALLGTFKRTLSIRPGEESVYFETRARNFLVENVKHRRIVITLRGRPHRLKESGWNGHIEDSLTVSTGDLKTGDWLVYAARARPGDPRVFQGEVQLIGPEGISVISDIDDTIKVSEVNNHRALLANTFLKDFEAVKGMEPFYQRWAQQGAVFHYISGTPWQLAGEIQAFLEGQNFPKGTLHLRNYNWKDQSFFSLFKSPEVYKTPMIEEVLMRFPQRQFILVGDSGEKDPEIYGNLARRFPGQIKTIYIREISGQFEVERFQKAFNELPTQTWKIFFDPAEL